MKPLAAIGYLSRINIQISPRIGEVLGSGNVSVLSSA